MPKLQRRLAQTSAAIVHAVERGRCGKMHFTTNIRVARMFTTISYLLFEMNGNIMEWNLTDSASVDWGDAKCFQIESK